MGAPDMMDSDSAMIFGLHAVQIHACPEFNLAFTKKIFIRL
jgi:hypothetical protein